MPISTAISHLSREQFCIQINPLLHAKQDEFFFLRPFPHKLKGKDGQQYRSPGIPILVRWIDSTKEMKICRKHWLKSKESRKSKFSQKTHSVCLFSRTWWSKKSNAVQSTQMQNNLQQKLMFLQSLCSWKSSPKYCEETEVIRKPTIQS